MPIPKSSTRRRFFPAVAFLAILLLPLAAPAAEHAAHNAPTGSGHQQHAVPSAPAEHIHPAATPVTGVGLDEQLGVRLPLDLTFRDEDGKPVRLGDLITKPTILAPVYYRCPNVCHFLQGELAQTLPQLNLLAGSDYQVLSISFDETETPEIARRNRDTYLAAAKGKVPAAGWRFLTGDLPAITSLTGTAGYRFQRVGVDFQHPVAILVVSPDGKIARYLHGTRILPKDLALALAEAKQGVTGTTIRKMVQYCFSYDPTQKTYVFNLLRVAATVILTTLGLFLGWLLLSGRKRRKGTADE